MEFEDAWIMAVPSTTWPAEDLAAQCGAWMDNGDDDHAAGAAQDNAMDGGRTTRLREENFLRA